ncbi:MAG: chromosomal replication initiator protein DnaA [Patescibacteria group bacterium]|jgi:chromosomal replication initiator protein
MTNDQLWEAALGELELTISKANFTTWFKNTAITAFEEGRITVGVPNTFTKTWLENKYHPSIQKVLDRISNGSVQEIRYQVLQNIKQQARPAGDIVVKAVDAATESGSDAARKYTGLNAQYTFDAYVVGKGNELAQAAAQAAAEKPGMAYNPLFLYGGTGLGKTHLMQAIGNRVLEMRPGAKVVYVTSEKFTNDFIQGISSGRGEKFKALYRTADVLLIDDIQFLSGRERTQEEFFHTFNALHQENKQIVISSDRPPKSITSLEHRLLSRFEWGMIADISLPDLETRIAILRSKVKERGLLLPDEVISYIGENIQSNIRELEGALNRVVAHHQIHNAEPSLEGTKQILEGTIHGSRRRSLTPKQIIQEICSFFDVAREDLIGQSRKKGLVVPRQIGMYILREELKSSFPAIGQELGGRDHTTAMHAYSKITNALNSDEKIRSDVELILQRLYA